MAIGDSKSSSKSLTSKKTVNRDTRVAKQLSSTLGDVQAETLGNDAVRLSDGATSSKIAPVKSGIASKQNVDITTNTQTTNINSDLGAVQAGLDAFRDASELTQKAFEDFSEKSAEVTGQAIRQSDNVLDAAKQFGGDAFGLVKSAFSDVLSFGREAVGEVSRVAQTAQGQTSTVIRETKAEGVTSEERVARWPMIAGAVIVGIFAFKALGRK